MGVMVQDLQAKGLRPKTKKQTKKKQVLPGASATSAGRTTCLLPSSALAQASLLTAGFISALQPQAS